MSSSISQDMMLDLLGDIVSILHARGANWCLCGGAVIDTGLTDEELLPLLQEIDPLWTIELVDKILSCGKKLGTLRQQTVGSASCVLNVSAAPQYFINCNMLNENPLNYTFSPIVPNLPQRPFHKSQPQPMY